MNGIRRNNFLIVGRVGLDLFTDPHVGIENATQLNVDMGGSSANTAAGIVKLGGHAALLTRVSDDAVGRACLRLLGDYGVDTTYVSNAAGEARNSLAVYESRLSGHQSVIYRNGAADFEMTVDDVTAADFTSFGALIIAGTVFAAEPSRTGAFAAIDRAKAAGIPVIFDVDYRPYSWPSAQVAHEVLLRASQQSDVIIGNDEEFGFIANGFDKGLDMARALAATTATLIVYKMGEKGAITLAEGREVQTGIYNVEALKPAGAGDAFMAGMLTGIANGMSRHDAVLRGSACAAIVVSKPGCAPAMPDIEQLADWLAQRPENQG